MTLALHCTDAPSRHFMGVLEKYVEDMTFVDFSRNVERHASFVMKLIDPERVKGAAFCNYVKLMNKISWEFEDQDNGGRGAAYNLAQRNPKNRSVGTLSLLRCFSETQTEIPGPEYIILDALAGDGTVTRLLKSNNISAPTMISGDLSSFMIEACMAQKFPCIRQSATYSLFLDSVLDGVLIAYGTHHLNAISRKKAVAEAYRTIKNEGRLVLHDFEIGKSSAVWFDKVVHPFSRTGHPHRHFTRDEMTGLLKRAGFIDVRVFSMKDPFVLQGNTAEEARVNALTHLYYMYDLVKISDNLFEALRRLEPLVQDILGGIQLEQRNGVWEATICREALVVVGKK